MLFVCIVTGSIKERFDSAGSATGGYAARHDSPVFRRGLPAALGHAAPRAAAVFFPDAP